MSRAFFLCFFIALDMGAKGQCDITTYKQMLKEGDQYAKTEKYDMAVKRFTTAMIACPDSSNIPQKRIVQVFNKIQQLKEEAVLNKQKAEAAKNTAETETQKAHSIILATIAREQLYKNPMLSIRLAELAWQISPTHSPSLSVQRILSEAFYQSQKNIFFEKNLNHSNNVFDAAFSLDGKKIVYRFRGQNCQNMGCTKRQNAR
jgi:hypothetical protein